MIFVIALLQIVILGVLWHISDELISLKVESSMIYEYLLGFFARYCAEHPDYGKAVFPKTWEKIQKEMEINAVKKNNEDEINEQYNSCEPSQH